MPGPVDKVYQPRLLKAAKPPEVVPLKLFSAKVIPTGGADAVLPATVISSARARSGVNARVTASMNDDNRDVRFTRTFPLWLDTPPTLTVWIVSYVGSMPYPEQN